MRVTITTDRGTIKANFMTKAILDSISAIFPLQYSVPGVRIKAEQGDYWKYYCNLHRSAAPADAKAITLAEAARKVAWCEECHTVLYLTPDDDRQWATLRDRLCPTGDYSQIEIYKPVERNVGTHYLISFHRLVPGALEPEIMFETGAFDYKDAYRDRREIWPNTIYVPTHAFNEELTRRSSQTSTVRTCCGYTEAEQGGWQLCGAAATETTCYQCYRPICQDHQEPFTYRSDKEPTIICRPCREEIRSAYGE